LRLFFKFQKKTLTAPFLVIRARTLGLEADNPSKWPLWYQIIDSLRICAIMVVAAFQNAAVALSVFENKVVGRDEYPGR
jgi:hypothetical protein